MKCEEPFRHWDLGMHPTAFGGLAGAAEATRNAWDEVRKALFNSTAVEWKRYQNSLESKSLCDNPAQVGPHTDFLFRTLCHKFVPGDFLWDVELTPDTTYHGGSVHVMGRGDYLQTHIDYALHPRLVGMERRLNLVYFLNPEWREEWGGALEFYDDEGREVRKRIFPKSGHAVLWEPGDLTYHGVQRVSDDCPTWRVTANVFFLAPARESAVRKRALFVPPR